MPWAKHGNGESGEDGNSFGKCEYMIQQNKFVKRILFELFSFTTTITIEKQFPQGEQGDKGDRGLTTTFKGDQFPTGIIEGPPGPPGPSGPAGMYPMSVYILFIVSKTQQRGGK